MSRSGSMRRFLRLLLWIATLAAIVAVGGWPALRGSLPQYSGEVHSAALAQAVSVERDALGTATLRAGNRRDLSWALGFVHAQNASFRWTCCAAAPPANRPNCSAQWHCRPTASRTRTTCGAPAGGVRRFAGGAAGRDQCLPGCVNAGLATLRVCPCAYLLTRNEAAPGRSEDSLLVVAAMAFTLNDAEDKRELAFTRMRAALSPGAFHFLAASGGHWDAPLGGPPLQWPDPPSADELHLRALDPRRETGSEYVAAEISDRHGPAARQPRLDLSHVPQHIVQRGNDRQPCFFSAIDHERYQNFLREIAMGEDCAVHAYVLMTNHVHLPMTPAETGSVARVMQALGRRYARYVNDRDQRDVEKLCAVLPGTETLQRNPSRIFPVASIDGVGNKIAKGSSGRSARA